MHASLQTQAPALAELCRRYRVRKLEMFGSAATGRERVRDVDFLVEFEPLDPESYADTYFGLLEALEELLGQPVDLVMASAVTNPYFLQEVAHSRTLVYGS